jgi:hypothetical protein
MKLWLISQDENCGYDIYDSAVVVAETEAEAKATLPSEYANWGVSWATGPEEVTAKLIGEAAESVTGIVCASFNAG